MNKNNISFKNRKISVAILAVLLLLSIATPLLTLVAASGTPTASLATTSGPNGTLVKVTGTGFGASEYATTAIGGQGGSTNLISLSYNGKAAGSSTESYIKDSYQLQTSSTGVLSGYFVIGSVIGGPVSGYLTPGVYTVIISDPSTSVIAGTFTITAPTVTLTPESGAAGTSVVVTASGFPTSNTTVETGFADAISTSYLPTFSGNNIAVSSGVYTSIPTTLSSNAIATNPATGAYLGTYVGTVSLPAVNPTVGPVFTLTDNWVNTATTELSLTTPTITISPSSGPVGTVVTVTASGFGPASTISSVVVGNVASSTSTATITPSSPAVTEQGTSAFLVTIPAGSTTTAAGVGGAQTVTVTDSDGNVATATFTVTPSVQITLGSGTVNSGTSYVPTATVAQVYVTASGFKASSALTITSSPGIPSEWTTESGYTVTTGALTSNVLYTNANGQVTFTSPVDTSSDYPTSVGQYVITISDGTNTVSTIINVVSPGDILAVPAASGSAGQTGISIKYFGSDTPTGLTLGGTSLVVSPVTWAAPSAWPTATTATFTVPTTSAAGVHTLALVGGSYNTAPFTTVSPSVTVISPSSASVGTTVTVVGTGYANNDGALSIQGATVAVPEGSFIIVGNDLIASFPVPNYLPGTYTLSLSDSANTATTSLTVVSPTIQITPTSSTLGTATIAITGSGFKAGDTLTVKFDTTPITATSPVGLTVVNNNGAILLDSGFVIPTTAVAGTHTITVVGASGAYATASYTVKSSVSLVAPGTSTAVTAVRPGATIQIEGTGFAASSAQTLTVNGAATSWYNVGVSPATVIPSTTTVETTTSGSLETSTECGFVVSSTASAGTLTIVVTDAAGNSATTTLTVLSSPAITLGSSTIVSGSIPSGVTIAGTGFTPSSLRSGGTPISAELLSGTTFVSSITLSQSGSTITSTTVSAAGTLPTTTPITFVVPSTVAAGTYTFQLTIGAQGTSTPVETATASLTVLGTPVLTAPKTAVSGGNVTISVTGLTGITSANFGGVSLVTSGTPYGTPVQNGNGVNQFGTTVISNTGSSAYTLTTWFIAPTTLFAGSYLLTLNDANTGLSVQAAISVTPAVTITATGTKGSTITVSGTGFAASSKVTATFNGAAVTLAPTTGLTYTETTSAGALSTTFTVPITAAATDAVVFTDASGNTVSASFVLTAPTIVLTPTTGAAGSTVEIIGNGFVASSPIVVQIGGQVVSTIPTALAANSGGSFIGYATVPSSLPSGSTTITATDDSNNVGTATYAVSGSNGVQISTSTLSSSAETTTSSGAAATTFAPGATVQMSFVLQSTTVSGNVVWAITLQQGTTVYNIVNTQAAITTSPTTVSFSQLIPAGAPAGTWTATIQVYTTTGTPLGVTTLTFTVS